MRFQRILNNQGDGFDRVERQQTTDDERINARVECMQVGSTCQGDELISLNQDDAASCSNNHEHFHRHHHPVSVYLPPHSSR